MDDLKLSVIIEALLNAKGFEDARANLKTVADQAATAAPKVKGVGDAAKKTGESFGGARGPVADLTRILLQNVGVTGAAGEAAKAAGTAMYFMEGAATATAVATSGIVAAIALGLPMLINWLGATKEQTDEQHNLRDSLESTSELVNKLIHEVPQLAAKYRETAAALHSASLDKQTDRLRELLNRQGELQKKIAATTNEWQKQNFEREINQLQAEVRLLTEAQEKGVTVSEMATSAIEGQTKATDEQEEAVKALTDAWQRHMQNVVEIQNAETEAQDAAAHFAEQQAKDAEKDINAETRRMYGTHRERLKAENEYQTNYAAMKRSEQAIDAQVAADKQELALATVAYVGQTLSALSAAFGGNKALAIAGAIIDTYAGAAAALGPKGPPWPANIAAAASIIATGLAHVQQIRKAQPVGFDDPFADLTARKLGRRSAEDFAKHFGATFSGALPGEMARQTVNHHHTRIDRSVTHNYGGISGLLATSPTAFERGLDRAMTRAERFRRRTTLGR